ncbi:MAG: SAM-dependent methyltransferase [Acidobacteriota bacterium]|nr:SAM-dependent methyltransferase [Acidobacteriota bacterium]
MPFVQFMESALYSPGIGYYRRAQPALGKHGDFFTASQVQPLFGLLMASLLPERPVLELGPGRGEMREAFPPEQYLAVDVGESLPPQWTGSIFANEFFDALPVVAGVRRGSHLRELYVKRHLDRHCFIDGPALNRRRSAYVLRYYPYLEDGNRFEIGERALAQLRRISKCLKEGTVTVIDYGWTSAESARFPEGTLMSYRRHRATADVLGNPGEQDITAHVCFSALLDCAREEGFEVERFETLAQTILRGLQLCPDLAEDPRHRQSLKMLLFGMGESFRTLTLRKRPLQNKKGPKNLGPHLV